MQIAIYQINLEKDSSRVAFMPYASLKTENLNCEIYEKVYEGTVKCSSLEEVYKIFNLSFPSDYTARSLSVSDVIEVKSSNCVALGFYYCDSFGFKEVLFNPNLCLSNAKKEKDTITVLLVKPNEPPKVVEIGKSLEAMKKVVGGWIEQFSPFPDEVSIICNEEGKLKGLPLNRAVYNKDGYLKDIIVGDFFIAYAPISSDTLLSLPQNLIDKYSELFKTPEKFLQTDNGIIAVPCDFE